MKKLSIKQLAPMVAMLLTLGVTLASAEDFARGGKGGHRGMGGRGLMRGLSQLDLTETQKTEIRRIMESRHAALESLRDRFQADRDALKAAADAPSPDAAAVGAAYLRVRANGETRRAGARTSPLYSRGVSLCRRSGRRTRTSAPPSSASASVMP